MLNVPELMSSLQLDARMDFRNLALVCKNLYSLAIPRLYSTIVLGPTLRERQNYRESLGGFRRKRTPNNVTNDNFRNNPWDYYRDLMLGLVENASGLPAQSVREVEILAFGGHDASIASSFDQNGMLARLVKAFPKLRHFRFARPDALEDTFNALLTTMLIAYARGS